MQGFQVHPYAFCGAAEERKREKMKVSPLEAFRNHTSSGSKFRTFLRKDASRLTPALPF